MLSRWWWFIQAHWETFRQYRAAVVTAEALVWHHGYKGLDAALKAAENPTGDRREMCGPSLGSEVTNLKVGDRVRTPRTCLAGRTSTARS